MGKKKKAKRAAEEAAQGLASGGFALPPQVAGIAAMVLGQVNSPAGRAMIAKALHNAADAIGSRGARAGAAPVAPAPPVPPTPVPPVPPVSPTPADHAPQFGAGQIDLPPEAAKAIDAAATQAARAMDAAASAIERWAERIGKPTPPVG